MSPLLITFAVGMLLLLGLAVVVGALEGRAQRAAWSRIAAARRALGERERALHEQRLDLLAWESALADETEARRQLM